MLQSYSTDCFVCDLHHIRFVLRFAILHICVYWEIF